jgi:hypothetical protein
MATPSAESGKGSVMRISDVFTLGGGYGQDGGYYNNDSNSYSSDNPCYGDRSYGGCERPIGPFNYGPRGDRKGLAHILGSPRDGGGLLGIFHH